MTLNLDPARRRYTPEEYLDAEELAEERSEYHDGEIFAMTGAKYAHNAIVSNIPGNLHSSIAGGRGRFSAARRRSTSPTTTRSFTPM